MENEFDFLWKNLPSPSVDYSQQKVKDLLFYTGLEESYFKGKHVLDAGCGSGRFTYAMQEMGAIVDSIDISGEAIKQCLKINSHTKQMSIFDLPYSPYRKRYDFILSWGVLHHLEFPHKGFLKLVEQLKQGGMLHIMVYNSKYQHRYKKWRKKFHTLDEKGKIQLCERLARSSGEIRGWYDALCPKFNRGFKVEVVKEWFENSGFKDIYIAKTSNININGTVKYL